MVSCALLLATACEHLGPSPPQLRSFPSAAKRPKPEIVSRRVIAEKGGPVDWCAEKNILAYANEIDRSRSEIYTVGADGSERRCITCGNKLLTKNLKRGLKGDRGRFYRTAPAWHPSCGFLVIEIGNAKFRPSVHERFPWGINHGLWLIAADGSWAEPIVEVGETEAAMRPHFSDSGDRLFWSTRERTPEVVKQGVVLRTPGAQNPWDGWYLTIADFEKPDTGSAILSNRVELFRGEVGWFGAAALSSDTIWFSRTERKGHFIDQLRRSGVDGSKVQTLLASPKSWEDQGEPSPWGSLLTFRSSKPYGWSTIQGMVGALRLELWALTRDGETVEITHFNKPVRSTRRAMVLDYAWGPRGRQIAVYTAVYEMGVKPRHFVEILTLNADF